MTVTDAIVLNLPVDPMAKNMPSVMRSPPKCRVCGQMRFRGMAVKGWREKKEILQTLIRHELAAQGMHFGAPFPFRNVSVIIDAYYAPLKGHLDTKKKRAEWRSQPKATKPDLDRIVNAVLDALTDVVYRDDVLVTTLAARKRWLDQDESGFIRVTLLEDRGD